MKISELNPNKKNPRKITDRRLAMLRDSIMRFGDLSGFVFNRRTKTLISGHQRQKVLSESEIFIETEYEFPTSSKTIAEGYVMVDGERFKYREVDADETWETEAMLAANKQGGEWDNDILKDILSNTPNINVEYSGFDIPDVEALNIEMPEYKPEEQEEEKEPQEPKDIPPQFIIAIQCSSEVQMQTLFQEFQDRNLECKLIT